MKIMADEYDSTELEAVGLSDINIAIATDTEDEEPTEEELQKAASISSINIQTPLETPKIKQAYSSTAYLKRTPTTTEAPPTKTSTTTKKTTTTTTQVAKKTTTEASVEDMMKVFEACEECQTTEEIMKTTGLKEETIEKCIEALGNLKAIGTVGTKKCNFNAVKALLDQMKKFSHTIPAKN